MEVQITYATGRIQFKKMENEFKDCARGNQWNQPGSTKTITEEDESYAKTTKGPPITAGSTSENAIVKVLGSIWNTDTDQFAFDLVDLSQHASLLPTTSDRY